MSKTLVVVWTCLVAGGLGALTGASVSVGEAGCVSGIAVGALAAAILIAVTVPENRATVTLLVLGAVILTWLGVASASPLAHLVASGITLVAGAAAASALVPLDQASGVCPNCGYPSRTASETGVCVECGTDRSSARRARSTRWIRVAIVLAVISGFAVFVGRAIG